MRKILPTRLVTLMLAALSILLLVGMFTPGANADVENKDTIFTFSGPVQVPGFRQTLTLPAGTYVFRLLDVKQTRNIVQILNRDRTRTITTLLAIPNHRLTPTTETVLTFAERPEGSPAALKAWFYPGDHYGLEFVYPKTEAMELARAVNEPVLSMPDEAASNLTKPATSADAPAVKALESAPVNAEAPSGKEVPISQVLETSPSS